MIFLSSPFREAWEGKDPFEEIKKSKELSIGRCSTDRLLDLNLLDKPSTSRFTQVAR